MDPNKKEYQKERITAVCHKSWETIGRGRLLLALSGGADSVAMLLAFKLAGVPLEAAHCNFNLRGEESLRDREFVKSICDKLDVPLHIAEFDTQNEAEKGESVEMTCRRLRYDFFRKLKREGEFSRIAVAHNSDDNIETFFLNALRGSGTRGLKGMETDTGEIIRPLLSISRKEILDFLEAHSFTYITDSSNLESDYRRNFLRNQIFPQLESRWEGFRKAITTSIGILARENAIVENALREALKDHKHFLPWEVINRFAEPETLIFHFIKPFGGTGVTAQEIAESAKTAIPGKRWYIGKKMLFFTRKGIEVEDTTDKEVSEVSAPPCRWERLQNTPQLFDEIQNAVLTEIYLPEDKNHYEWRHPTKEMKIKSLGMDGRQTVLKVLKDAGIPASRRHYYPVLTDRKTGEPVWIPGLKRSRLHLVNPETPWIYHCIFPNQIKTINLVS